MDDGQQFLRGHQDVLTSTSLAWRISCTALLLAVCAGPSPSLQASRKATACEIAAVQLYGVSAVLPRVRGGIRVPRKVHNVEAQYPRIPANTRARGHAWLVQILIAPSGAVADVWVQKELPFEPAFPTFTEAALDAIRQWRFEPTIVAGKGVPVCMAVSGSVNWP